MPFTVLDMHGWHGKQTMAVFQKKMHEGQADYLSKLGKLEDVPEVLNHLVFAFEGGRCNNEIRVTNTYNEMWSAYFKGKGVEIPWEDLEDSFKPYLQRLFTLREWMFKTKFGKIIDEIAHIDYGGIA